MPQEEDEPTFAVRSKFAGGAGSAGVIYEASSRVRGSWRATPLPSLSLRGSILVGSARMVMPVRESVAARSSFLTAIGILLRRDFKSRSDFACTTDPAARSKRITRTGFTEGKKLGAC